MKKTLPFILLITATQTAFALENRTNFPLAAVSADSDDYRPIQTAAITSTVRGWYQAVWNVGRYSCAAFDYRRSDAERTQLADEYKAKALVGYSTRVYPYDLHISELGTDATLAQKFANQPFGEYKKLIKQNQFCESVASYLYKDEILDGWDSTTTVESLRTPEQFEQYNVSKSAEADTQIIDKIYSKVEYDYLSSQAVASFEYANNLKIKDVEDFTKAVDAKYQLWTDQACSIQRGTITTEAAYKAPLALSAREQELETKFSSTVLSHLSYSAMYQSLVAGIQENATTWKDYCSPIVMPTSVQAPQGKEASALLTLNSLGYKQIPQTRVTGTHSEASYLESPYSIGILSPVNELTKTGDFQSQFGLLSKTLEPYMSTGIQNRPIESEGNPHQFFYERHNDQFKKIIGDKVLSAIGDGALNDTVSKLMGNQSSNPNVQGYAIKPNIGADADSFSTSIAGLKKMLSQTQFLMSNDDGSLSSGSWGSNPFNTQFLSSSATPYKPKIIDLYRSGYNWDGGKCTKSGDTGCKFAFSLALSGAGCGGMYFKHGILAESRQDKALTQELRNNGSGWFNTKYISNDAGRRCDLKWHQKIKADMFYDLTFDEMNTALNFGLDDLGVILRPGYFFSKSPAKVGSFATSQMKMARYENASNEGLKTHVVFGDADVREVKKYQTTSQYCTNRGLTAVSRNGKTYCEAEPCTSGYSFDSNTGICVKENTSPCPVPTFQDPFLKIKSGTLKTIVQNGRCLSTYEVDPIKHSGWFKNGQEVPYDETGASYSGATQNVETFEAAGIDGLSFETAPEKWRQGGKKGNGNWSATSTELRQSINGNPTYFVKNKIFGYGTFEGDMRTTDGDDDFMGIVFGYKSKDKVLPSNSFGSIPSNFILDEAATYYKIDWKQGNQGSASQGISFRRFLNVDVEQPNWDNDRLSTTYDKKIAFSNAIGGWARNQKYTLKLKLEPSRVQFWVKKASEPISAYTKIFDIRANAIRYRQGLVEKDLDGNYYFPTGRFGFYNYSQSNVYYSGFRISDYTEIKCDEGHISLADKYGLPTGICQQTQEMSCPTGLDVIANNGSVVCGKATNKCSLSDLTQTIVDGKIQYGKCSYLASDETSIDVLQDVTSRVFNNNYYKKMGGLGLVKPINLVGSEVPAKIAAQLNKAENWKINADGEYKELNDLLKSSTPNVNQEQFARLVQTQATSTKSRNQLNEIIGMDYTDLPEFQVDVLNVNVDVKIRELNDLNIGNQSYPLSCLSTEKEVSRFPTGDDYPVSIHCMSLDTNIEGVYKYKWDPFNHHLSIPLAVKVSEQNTLLVEAFDTLVDTIPTKYALDASADKETLNQQVLDYLNAEITDPDSLIVAALKCNKYVFDLKDPIKASDQEALVNGSVTCYQEDIKNNTKQMATFSKYVSTAPVDLDSSLEAAPPVAARVGRLVDNPLVDSCTNDLTNNTKTAPYPVPQITDAVSGQRYEDKSAFNTSIKLNYPEAKTTTTITNDWTRAEIARHLEKFLGTTVLGANGSIERGTDGQAQITKLEAPNSVLYDYLTVSGRTNLAELISVQIKNAYPFNKDKLVIQIPMSSFKSNAELTALQNTELGEKLHFLSNAIDTDGYSGEAESLFTQSHTDIDDADFPITSLRNQNGNGLLLPADIMSSDIAVEVVGNFDTYEEGADTIVIGKTAREREVTGTNIVSPSCSYITPSLVDSVKPSRVNQNTTSSQYWGDVAALSDGSYVNVYTSTDASKNPEGISSAIYARVFNADGTTYGDEFVVSSDRNFNIDPVAVGYKDGTIGIVYPSMTKKGSSGYWSDGNDAVLVFRRFNKAGIPLTDEIVISSHEDGYVYAPTVSLANKNSLAGDNAMISWVHRTVENSVDKSYGFYTVIDINGNIVKTQTQVNTDTSKQAKSPAAAALDGGSVVVFQEYIGSTESWDVYGQYFDEVGEKVGASFKVSEAVSGYAEELSPEVDSSNNGRSFAVIWGEKGDSNSHYKVPMRLYKSSTANSVSSNSFVASDKIYTGLESITTNATSPDPIVVWGDGSLMASARHGENGNENPLSADYDSNLMSRHNKVRFYDTDGVAISVATDLRTVGVLHDLYGARATAANDGTYIVAYHSTEQGSWDWFNQRFNAAGTKQISSASYALFVDESAYNSASTLEKLACTEIYGQADATAGDDRLDTTVSIDNSIASYLRKPMSILMKDGVSVRETLKTSEVADYVGCNLEAMSVGATTLTCDVNNIHTYGSNKWSIIDPSTNKNILYIELDDATDSLTLNQIKNNTMTDTAATMYSNKYTLDSSGDLEAVSALTTTAITTHQIGDLFRELIKANQVYKVKSYPVNMGNHPNADYNGYHSFTIARGAEGIDEKIAETISETRNVCLSVSDYDSAIATELNEVTEAYEFIRKNADIDGIVNILMGSNAGQVSDEPRDGRDTQKKKFFGGWSGCGSGCIQDKTRAQKSAEDTLIEYLEGQCANSSSVFSQKVMNANPEKTMCEKIDELLVNPYSYQNSDFGVNYSIPSYQDFFTGNNVGAQANLDGFGSSLMSALLTQPRNVSLNLIIWGKKDWRYSVNSRLALKTQVLRGLTVHESEFLRQAAGSIDLDFVDSCTANLAATGEFTARQSQINFKRLLTNKSAFKHLNPETRNQTVSEYKAADSGLSTNWDFRTSSASVAGNLGAIEAGQTCSNFLNPKAMAGHDIFENIINRAVVSGLQTSGGGIVDVVSPRVFSNQKHLDEEEAPNWLQGKVCKDSYMNVPYALSVSKMKANPNECDGSINSPKCAANAKPDPGLLTIIFRSSKVKRDFQNWANDTLQLQTNLCGTKATSKTSSSDLATPTNSRDKTIIITKLNGAGATSTAGYASANNSLVYAQEDGVLLHQSEVDKAKMGIHLIDNPLYKNTLMINSIDVFNSIADKKTGITREIPSDANSEITVPDIQAGSGDPIELLVKQCMDFKAQVAYKKPDYYEGYEYIYNRQLIKTYPNKNKNFAFVDPRSGQEREVKRCSDIFINSEEVYIDPSNLTRAERKKLYLSEFLKDNGSSPEYMENSEFTQAEMTRRAAELEKMNSEDGFTIEDQGGGTIGVNIGKNKDKGVTPLKDKSFQNINGAVPNLEGKNQKQKDAITEAKRSGDGTDGALDAGFSAAIKILDVASMAPGAIGSKAESVKEGVKATRTATSVAGAISAAKSIKDQNGNIANILDMETSEVDYNKESIGRISVSEKTLGDGTPEDIVDKVMQFDAQLENYKEPKPTAGQYDRERAAAEDAMSGNAVFGGLSTSEQDRINSIYGAQRKEIKGYNQMKSGNYSSIDEYNAAKGQYIDDSTSNNTGITFRGYNDYSYRESTGFDQNQLSDAYNMNNGATGKIQDGNVENTFKMMGDADPNQTTSDQLQKNMESQINFQKDSFGIFNGR